MAARQSKPEQGNLFAAGGAILLLAAWHADPASANSAPLCDDVATLAFEVPAEQLQVDAVSHEVDAQGTETLNTEIEVISPDHYLAPRVEAALRRVFEDIATPVADGDKPATEEPPEMNTRVPGLSDEELARYKRLMYRVDI